MIIKSLLDTDLYKLTMQQFAFHFMTNHKKEAVYALKCRSGEDLTVIKKELKKELKNFQKLKFSKDEIKYLSTLKIFKKDYLKFLKELDLRSCKISIKESNNNLEVRVNGPWHTSILYEVPILAMVQELYFNKIYKSKKQKNDLYKEGMSILENKIKLIQPSDIKFADFGTRRRFSFDWHLSVTKKLKKEVPKNIIGTSNILIAKKLNMKPIGTMAHEFFSAMQGLDFIPIELSQKYALHQWYKEYKGELAIALTDIFNIDVFLHDCDFDLLNKYSGFRHDSGCPYYWGNRIINHLKGYNIDPKNKNLVFSDGLNIPKAIKINDYFKNQTNVVFGIGTNLTNDFNSHKAMSLVMKMVSLNKNAVIKVSDEPEKLTCEDPSLTKHVLNFIEQTKKKEVVYPSINNTVDIILHNKDSVLLIKRGDESETEFKKLALPGGFVDYTELFSEAIKREVLEEIGLNLDEKKLKFVSFEDSPGRDPRKRTISHVFSYKITNDEIKSIKINNKEVLSFKMYKFKNLKKSLLAFDHYNILKKFLN